MNIKYGCKARLVVVRDDHNDLIIAQPPKKEHNHPIRAFGTDISIAMSNLRDKAIVDQSLPCQILSDFYAADENEYTNTMMPSKNALKQRIHNAFIKYAIHYHRNRLIWIFRRIKHFAC